jgi:hypothetical protein
MGKGVNLAGGTRKTCSEEKRGEETEAGSDDFLGIHSVARLSSPPGAAESGEFQKTGSPESLRLWVRPLGMPRRVPIN